MATFRIIKHDNRIKINGEWVVQLTETVIAEIEAKTRREAFKTWYETASKTYVADFRDLSARREHHAKRRRVEVITVIKG